MKKKGFAPEQIITMLGEAQALLSHGVTEQTYCRSRREYGEM